MAIPLRASLTFNPLLAQVTAALPADQEVYLVGGAVRDALLRRDTHDLDFALPGDAQTTARRVADALGGAYYPLDEDHPTGRVVLPGEGGSRVYLDFAAFRGPDLTADLRARDFTINALAADLRSPTELHDPLNGLVDLHQKRLRACSGSTFQDDPLRVLRAARMATAFKLKILPGTLADLRAAVPSLARVSPERVRDELFRILGERRPDTSVRLLDTWGTLPRLLPELEDLHGLSQPPPHITDVWTHTLRTLHHLEKILDVLGPVHDEEASADLAMGLMVGLLGRFREGLEAHLAERLNPHRSLRPLLFLGALYHDAGKPESRGVDDQGRTRFFGHAATGAERAESRARRLRLSNQEISRLGTLVRHHMRPLHLTRSGPPPTRRAVYRFFRDTGPAGVDVALLSLADQLATYGAGLPPDHWADHLAVVRALLEAWWEQRSGLVDPPALLRGDDLISQLNMTPGPAVGRLLAALREAQASEGIEDREAALAFARDWLNKKKSQQE